MGNWWRRWEALSQEERERRMDVAEVELRDIPLRHKLAVCGYYTRALVAAATDAHLLQVPMLGPVTLRKIRAAIPHDPLAPYRDTVHVEAVHRDHSHGSGPVLGPCDCPCGKDGCPPAHCHCQEQRTEESVAMACCRCGYVGFVYSTRIAPVFLRERVLTGPPEAPAEGARMSARAWRELNSFGEPADG